MSSAPVSDATRVNANSQAVLEVFKKHAWIEPGEPIEEAFMLQLPAEKLGRVALKLELRIVTGGTEWNADSIVDFSSVSNYGPTD